MSWLKVGNFSRTWSEARVAFGWTFADDFEDRGSLEHRVESSRIRQSSREPRFLVSLASVVSVGSLAVAVEKVVINTSTRTSRLHITEAETEARVGQEFRPRRRRNRGAAAGRTSGDRSWISKSWRAGKPFWSCPDSHRSASLITREIPSGTVRCRLSLGLCDDSLSWFSTQSLDWSLWVSDPSRQRGYSAHT